MKLTVHVWRQASKQAAGKMETYKVADIDENMSFLEMLDVMNEQLIAEGKEPVEFDHDCREGICGSCSMMINGEAHGPERGTTACQLHMRSFRDGDEIYVEPWRAAAFPVLRDLVVDRRAFDEIIKAGGFITANTGAAPDANAIPIGKEVADEAFMSAACIGCGACVAACPNASAMLFVGAKITHLSLLPQGEPEELDRARAMVLEMDEQGFGSCTNHYECMNACPKEIKIDNIAKMNRKFLKGSVTARS